MFPLPHGVSQEQSQFQQQPDIPCFACGADYSFKLASAVIEHLESGKCPSNWHTKAVHYLAMNYDESQHYIRGSHGALIYGTKRRVLPTPKDLLAGPWACAHCKMVCWSWATSLQHVLQGDCWNHTLPVFKCPSCHLRFTTLSALVGHYECPCRDDGQMRNRIMSGMLEYLRRELSCPIM